MTQHKSTNKQKYVHVSFLSFFLCVCVNGIMMKINKNKSSLNCISFNFIVKYIAFHGQKHHQ